MVRNPDESGSPMFIGIFDFDIAPYMVRDRELFDYYFLYS